MAQRGNGKPTRLGSLRNKLLIWFLLLSLVPAIGLGVMAFVRARNALQRNAADELTAMRTLRANQLQDYFAERQTDLGALVQAVRMLRSDTFNKLEAVRTIKKGQIEAYFAERRSDVGVLANTLAELQLAAYGQLDTARAVKKAQIETYFDQQFDHLTTLANAPVVIEALADFEQAGSASLSAQSELPDIEERYASQLARYRRGFDFDDLFLVAADGQVVYATDSEIDSLSADSALGESPKRTLLGRAFVDGLNGPTLQDFGAYSSGGELPTACLAAPVSFAGEVAGVVIAGISIDRLNAVMQQPCGLCDDGDVYLVGSDKTFRAGVGASNPGADPNPRRTVDTEAVERALAGETGHELIVNDQGDHVLSSWGPLDVAGVRWALVVELGVQKALLSRAPEGRQDLFTQYKEAFDSNNLYLIDRDGHLFYAVAPESDYQTNLLSGPYKDSSLGELVAEVLETGQLQITDFERYAPSQYVPALFVGAPVFHDDHVDFVLALQLSIDGINAVMREHSGLGETGETYLVGVREGTPGAGFRQFYFRSDSRFVDESTILNSKYPVNTEAARSALAGEPGQGIGLNYRHQRVLSSWTPLDIPGLQWALIAEIGVEEAFSPRAEVGHKDFFNRYADEYGYDDVYLISPDGGYVFYSVAHEPEYRTSMLSGPYHDTNLGRLVVEVLATRRFGMTDFQRYAPSHGIPAAFIAQPLINRDGELEVIVAVQLSHHEIDAIMQERAGLGQTGETYLVGIDKLWRSESRFLDQLGVHSTILNPAAAVDTPASREALAGESGTRLIENYQGERVLSSWSPFVLVEPTSFDPEGVRWAVIAEMEASEVNRPAVQMAVTGGAIVFGAALVIVLAILLVSRHLSAPIAEVASAATAVAAGDLTRRVEVNTGDEIEQLANAFNQMADEIADMVSALQDLATTDPLTGLYNRRQFFDLAEAEIERARRYKYPVSMMILDLDNFKQYNDRYGHLAGDDLLAELADLIVSITRETDVVARYGGEEFVLVLPETDTTRAVSLAERLWHAVRSHEFDIRKTQHAGRITISVGVAAYPEHAGDLVGLIHAADMALLEAKVEKDCVCLAVQRG